MSWRNSEQFLSWQSISIFFHHKVPRNWAHLKTFCILTLQCWCCCNSYGFSFQCILLISLKKSRHLLTLTRKSVKSEGKRMLVVNGNKRSMYKRSICLFDKDLSTQHTLWIKQTVERNSQTANLHLAAICFAIFFLLFTALLFMPRRFSTSSLLFSRNV